MQHYCKIFRSMLFILLLLTGLLSGCDRDTDLLAANRALEAVQTVEDDNDGLANDIDPNPNNLDTDGDGIPDGMDADPNGDGTNDNGTDTDNDGINNASDADETGGADANGDGIDDNVLDPEDADNDEQPDVMDPDPADPDTDDDGINDGADADMNGDGVNDNGTDTDNDGINDNADDTDNTGDFPGGVIAFSQAGPVGGGYPNVVSWDPNRPGHIYYGSDIGGTGRSKDYGRTFETVGRGLGYEESHQKIAALNAVDLGGGNTVIVGGTGFKGTGGEVISSSDGGNTWNHDSSDISFSAQNSNAPLPTGRPRSTDPSLIQWVGGSTWVAGTYKDGVWISRNNRSSWTRLNVFSGDVHVRSMAMSPDDPNTLYVGLWGNDSAIPYKGLWKISNLNGNVAASQVPGVPDVVESIVVLGNRIYLACGVFGVRRYVPSNNNLTDITGPIGSTVMATAIHGVADAWNTDRIVVGTAEGAGNIWVSDDSGSTWNNTTTSGVSFNPWGSNESLIVFDTHSSWALGGSNCDVATIQVSPHNPDAWVVCSTSAIWSTTDAGGTWRPANGFQILTFRDVEISRTGTIAAGNVDHDVVLSIDGGTEWKAVGLGGVTVGHGLTFSPAGSELAFGNGERDNNTNGGKLAVASSPDTPFSPGLLEINNPAAPKRIVGLAWVVLPNGTERLVTAIDNGGIRTVDRSTGGGWANWNTRTTSFMNAQDNGRLRCSVVSNGGSTIFVYDRQTGVWRSTDYGESWTSILVTPAGEDEGYLAYDTDGDRLYISTPSSILRMDEASTSNTTTNLSVPTNGPGAMALDPHGRLLVFAEPASFNDSDTHLFRNDNPQGNQHSWVDIADDAIRRVVPTVTDMDASAQYIVLVTAGKGMLVSQNDAPNP